MFKLGDIVVITGNARTGGLGGNSVRHHLATGDICEVIEVGGKGETIRVVCVEGSRPDLVQFVNTWDASPKETYSNNSQALGLLRNN